TAFQGKVRETGHVDVRVGVQTGDRLVWPQLAGDEIPLPTGQERYCEEILGHRFQVSAPSFFQVNTRQAENLVHTVIERLEPSGTRRAQAASAARSAPS